MVQCKCKTDDGSRCKRTVHENAVHPYCWQHLDTRHSKMRCVSLSRNSIGFRSPKKRPSFPRPAHSPKKARKSPKKA